MLKSPKIGSESLSVITHILTLTQTTELNKTYDTIIYQRPEVIFR